MLLDALAYAERGWPIFPCGKDKAPLVSNGVLEATTNPDKIRDWWTSFPDANIGFACGQANMMVVDVDPGASAEDIAALPETELSALTPRGGEHLFYMLDNGIHVMPSQSKIAPHIDVRSYNSYVLLSPSETDDGTYKWRHERPPAPAPAELIEKANTGRRDKTADHDKWIIEPDLPEHVTQAIKWLETEAKIAIQGQGGDGEAYATGAYMRSLGISRDLALELMWDHWNPRNVPPWDEGERPHFEDKIRNAYSYATSAPGNVTAEYRRAKRKMQFKAVGKVAEAGEDGSLVLKYGRHSLRNRAAINHIAEQAWLLEGVIPENANVIMFAPPGSYKTFMALDMALSIATGWPTDPAYFTDDMIVSPGSVIYMTSEGLGGIRKRVSAWEQEHYGSREVAGFYLFDPTPKLIDEPEGIVEFIKESGINPKLIVIDTVSRVFQGADETNQREVSAFTGLMDMLRGAGEGTSVLALHHAKKGQRDEIRGSSVFEGDADVLLRLDDPAEIAKSVYRTRLVTIKQKDGSIAVPVPYHFREVEIGDATTLVAVAREEPEPAEKPAQDEARRDSGEKSSKNKREFKRRADHAQRRVMIEQAAIAILNSIAGKSWSVNALAGAVAHKVEGLSASNARDHLNECKVDHGSPLHGRYDPLSSRFQ